jgi:hypothetical protein
MEKNKMQPVALIRVIKLKFFFDKLDRMGERLRDRNPSLFYRLVRDLNKRIRNGYVDDLEDHLSDNM